MPLSRMENTTFAMPSIIDSHDMGLRTVYSPDARKKTPIQQHNSGLATILKIPVKGTLTRLETFTSEKTVSKDTSVTEIEIKLKKIEQLQINLDKIAEDYCEIETSESLKIIQLDIEDINQRIETTEVCKPIYNSINGITQSWKYSANIEVSNRDYTFARHVQFSLLPKIADAIPVSKLNISDLNIPASVELADSNFHMPGQIDILIGSELFFVILNPEQHYLQEGNVILQNTKFGYLVTGTLPQSQQQANCCLISEPSLDITVKKFFELESLPDDSKEITKSEDEIYCEEHFVSTYKRDKTGRFLVRLPIKENVETLLGYSKENAIKPLNGIWEKLNKNNTMGTLYKEFMNEYELLGHMEEIKNGTLDKINYYIPHHSVYKPEKTSTPLIVVFDASAKTTSGFSLKLHFTKRNNYSTRSLFHSQ
ncbi:integrase catalytic domain-containing protein [Trichonephila clavipes]|nr:integrase catalytic domain-containing protein [Trichonephila clavipes]